MTLQQQIDRWFTGREDEFVDALAPLIAIDSTTGTPEEGKPFGAGPAAALEAALALAKSWGFATANDEGYVGLVDLNEGPDQLHILAHLDVVGVGDGWDTDPFTLVREGDLIYGRGTDDDKGPAVAALMAMRCVKELGLPLTKNVKLVLGTDEETGSRDIAHYYSHAPFAPNAVTPDSDFPVTNIEKARYAPTFGCDWDPVDAYPCLTSVKGGIRSNVAPGYCEARIAGHVEVFLPELEGIRFEMEEDEEGITLRSYGKEAHASTPDEGRNAITAMLEALTQLPLHGTPQTDAVHRLSGLFPYGDNAGEHLGVAQRDEASGALTLTLSVLDITCEGFSGQFDVRAPICATEDNLVRVMEAVCAQNGWYCKGEMVEAHVVEADSDFIRTLLDCYEHFSGKKGYCEAIGGGTYVHEIPGGVAFGAGDPGFDSRLHGANERARISQLLMTGRIYAAVIAGLCE